LSAAGDNKHELIIRNARAEAMSEVMQYENGLLEYCAPNKEIKPICTFRARKEVFDSFVFSPNGEWIALRTAERVYLWNRKQHRSIQVFDHSCFVNALAFSQDGKLLITGDNQEKLHIWDIHRGECVREATMEDKPKNIHTTSNGLMVIQGYWDELFVWDIETGRQLYVLPKKTRGFDITPDGEFIITSNYSSEKTEDGYYIPGRWWYSLNYWECQTGVCLEDRRLDFPKISIVELVITPDGKKVFTITDDGKAISFIDLKTGELRKFKDGINKNDRMTGLKINAAGDSLMVCRDIHSNDLHVWNVNTGNCREIIPGRCDSAQFSPDSGEFAAVRDDGAVHVWEIDSGRSRREVVCHADSQTNFALSPKGDMFVTDASDNALMIWDLRTGRSRTRLTGHRKYISDIVISPDGKTLVSAGQDNTVRLWDLDSGQCISVWRLPQRPLTLAVSPDCRWVAVAEGHALEKQWMSIREMRTGQTVYTLPREDYHQQSLAFSRDGRSLYIGCSFVAIHWDFESGRVQRLGLHENIRERSTSRLLFSHDRTICVTGQYQRNIYGYDLRCGEEIFRVKDLPKDISAMTFHPNKPVLITVDDDNQMVEWHLQTGERLRTFTGLPPCVWRWRHILNLEVFSEGKLLVAVSYDGVITFWDYESSRLLATSYALDEGFLWTTPPDDFAKDGWLYTDRPDLVSLAAIDPLDGHFDYLEENDKRFSDYLQIYNDGEMVMTRIHAWERYQELINLRVGHKTEMDSKLIEARIKRELHLLQEPSDEGSC
jgi:WD40 repeat protein